MRRLVAVLASLVALMSVAAPAKAMDDGWYSVPYSSQLYVHWHWSGGSITYPGDGDEWRQDGYPRPRPAPTAFVKYSWAPSIYGVTFFEDGWEWTQLAPEQWARAGYPRPYVPGWIEGTDVYKWSTSPEIFAELDGVTHRLSGAEWAAMGYREPRFEPDGFMKLSWDSTIAHMYSPTDGWTVDFQEWSEEGFPTPEVRAMLPGDSVCQYPGSDTLYYHGSSFWGPLTPSQWAAAGLPAPVAC